MELIQPPGEVLGVSGFNVEVYLEERGCYQKHEYQYYKPHDEGVREQLSNLTRLIFADNFLL
jgi:hypothetical protein